MILSVKILVAVSWSGWARERSLWAGWLVFMVVVVVVIDGVDGLGVLVVGVEEADIFPANFCFSARYVIQS